MICTCAVLCAQVHECVSNGGKVLIPVFALGRAQELCLLLDSYWERMNLNAPIYFSAGMAEKVRRALGMNVNECFCISNRTMK